MKRRTFIAFVAPSVALMLTFIAAPLVFVFVQSFYQTRTQFEQVVVENCTPGFPAPVCTKETRTRPKLGADGKPITRSEFAGLAAYRNVLGVEAMTKAYASGGNGWNDLMKIDFWRALRFTIWFTLVTLPLILGVGLLIALAMNEITRRVRGPAIFISLLPMIITPVIGSLSVRWLFHGDGILTRAMEALSGTDISMFAQAWTIELMMLIYKVWHTAPFAFIIFYAGLQTLDRDTLESAIVDGASRWERLRHVTIPHLMPLIVFVSLIHLMDSYRVFDEIIGFSSQAHVISLQWLTFSFLMPDETGNRSIARASASSMLTMIGIVILLTPLLIRTWRDFARRRN
jgi:multiple sugar transport system permease protein